MPGGPGVHVPYRADIDGLRALAVLFVVAYHAFPERLPGGYIGVDVFFVISGFLISTILMRGLATASFSIPHFYGRRIRRIFTALIVVLAACYGIGRLVLLPDEYSALGKHIAGGAGFASNLVLWGESGYFDTSAASKPLLHLWSLGIEEQFYIVWPFLLAWAVKRRVGIIQLTATLLCCSFAYNVMVVSHDQVAGFYSPLTRFWELMMGSLLAGLALSRPLPTHAANARAVAGAALLLAALLALDERSRFPGWWALLPTIGTALIISAGAQAWVNRALLSNRVLVWIGLISFPLYLWHWPLLSFLRIVGDSPQPTPNARIAVVVVSFALAAVTYLLIERPIRMGGHTRTKIATLCLLMALLGGLGYRAYASDGDPSRFPTFARQLGDFKYEYKRAYRGGSCFLWSQQEESGFDPSCRGSGKVFLWGDSHAAQLYPGLSATKPGLAQYTKAGCPPLLDTDIDGVHHCKAANAVALARIEQDRPEEVILAGAWAVHDWRRMAATLDALHRAGVGRIDVVGPFPEWTRPLPRTLMNYLRRHGDALPPQRLALGWDHRAVQLDREMQAFTSAHGVHYVSAMNILCDQDGCLTRLGDDATSLVAWDESHLTDAGATYIASHFER